MPPWSSSRLKPQGPSLKGTPYRPRVMCKEWTSKSVSHHPYIVFITIVIKYSPYRVRILETFLWIASPSMAYINHGNGPALLAVNLVALIVTFFLCSLRMYVRCFVVIIWKIEDWFFLAAEVRSTADRDPFQEPILIIYLNRFSSSPSESAQS